MASQIELIGSGKCYGCLYAGPDPVTIYADNVPILRTFRCKHEALCDGLEEHLRIMLGKENENMIAWFNVAWGGPKLHEERDENDGVVYKMSDPVLICTAEGEMLVACHEVDPDMGFDGWITPRSSWVIENVTHWAPLPKKPERLR